MCGRFTLASDADELIEAFDLPDLTFELVARYNIAPGQRVLVVGQDQRGRRIGPMTWGLVPEWADEAGAGFINARSETVRVKPSFREAYARRRCLVPADGFYEWKREAGAKVPFWFRPAKGGVLAFAGVWARWERDGAVAKHTFAILTTEANDDVRGVHDRMPVLIGPGDRSVWLEKRSSMSDLGRCLTPAPPGTLVGHPVSSRVNRVDADDVGLIEPV